VQKVEVSKRVIIADRERPELASRLGDKGLGIKVVQGEQITITAKAA
jgi:hypothetical protein